MFKLFCLENEMRQFFNFLLLFFKDSLKYHNIVLLEMKGVSEIDFSDPFSLTLKETTLSEQGGIV